MAEEFVAPSVDNNTQESEVPTQNTRRKTDFAWNHCTLIGSKAIKCRYCEFQINGGGIYRMKEHLAGIRGNVASCREVPDDIRFQIKGYIVDAKEKKKKENERATPVVNVENYDVVDELLNAQPVEDVAGPNTSKRQKIGHIASYMKAGGGIDSSQPTLKSTLQSKEKVHATDMSIALWFYDACIPLNTVNSPYFQPAIDRIACMGRGYKAPSSYSLRVPLLKEAKTQVTLTLDSFRSRWVDIGCTIMGDGWKDMRSRPLINFLVYCPAGISFIKSVDASNIITSGENLCALFSEIVEMVGPANVVHIVTDNAANYKRAGTLLNERYSHILWSPCAAHCINLIMKDIGELPKVKRLAKNGSKITVFVNNHKGPLSWRRRRLGWTELISPNTTRFGTTFIALRSIYDHREHLEAMVMLCGAFKKYLNDDKDKKVKQIVLDSEFWNDCLAIVKVMGPIMRLLHLCDADEKPSLGYVYEGMSREINAVKETFRNRESYYKVFVDIINSRWDRMLRLGLHAAAFWLNPAFQYDRDSLVHRDVEPYRGLLEIIHSLAAHEAGIMNEISTFRDRKNSFGMPLAISTTKSTTPNEWWRLWGHDAPILQKLAIRILSQTSSASGCQRNWSVFERIHTKKRNRLEHQRLNDLVFVHYNLRLQNRGKERKRSYDPIDYESIDKVDFWIVEEEPSGELDSDELDELIEENFASIDNILPSNGIDDVDRETITDQINLSQVGAWDLNFEEE